MSAIPAFRVLFATMLVLWSGLGLRAASDSENLAFSVTMSPLANESFARTAGDLELGFGRMETTTSAYGKTVRVELLRQFEYQRGSGPLSGFFTLIWDQGDVLALRYRGEAFQNPDGTVAIDGTVEVVGGARKYSRSVGRGVVHGFRSGSVGNSVVYTLHVEVENPPQAAPGPGDVGSLPVPVPPAPDAGPRRGFDLLLAANAGHRFFREIGRLRDMRYGGASWSGKANRNGRPVEAELVGQAEFPEGSGRFDGLLFLGDADGSLLACRCSGATFRRTQTGSSIRCNLEVIRGVGRWASAKGSGTLDAKLADADGAALEAHVDLPLD
jgi:hypothetical protein